VQLVSIADQIEKIGRALTARELSKYLSVSTVTIFKLASAGRIPSFRMGGCVRFDPRRVATWLRSGECGAVVSAKRPLIPELSEPKALKAEVAPTTPYPSCSFGLGAKD